MKDNNKTSSNSSPQAKLLTTTSKSISGFVSSVLIMFALICITSGCIYISIFGSMYTSAQVAGRSISLSTTSRRYFGDRSYHTPSSKGITSYFPYGPVTAARQIMIMLNSTSQWDVDKGARALGRFREELAPQLLNICKEGDYGLPGPIMTYLVDYCGKEGPAFVHQVLRDTNKEPSIRAKAAFALGRKRYRPAVSDLIEALNSREWIIRSAAARAIGIIGHKESKPLLQQLFYKESDNRVLPEMAQALFRLGTSSGIPWLISTCKNHKCKGIPGMDSKHKLMVIASEWPRYNKIMKLDEKNQEKLLMNWIYEFNHGTLPSLQTIQ